MSTVRKRTVRRLAVSPEQTLRRVRALYMIVYNDPKPLQPLTIELFHTLGELLEGVPPEDLDLHLINKTTLLDELDYTTEDENPN